jgi:nucleotide-binding universal stress UspA family protein
VEPCLLIAIDLSDASRAVVQRAAALARGTGARMEVLHVVTRDEALARGDDVRAQLTELCRPLRDAKLPARTHVLEGEPAAEILAQARRLDAASIVIGRRGHCATYERMIGSVTEAVIRGADCPVEVVPIR